MNGDTILENAASPCDAIHSIKPIGRDFVCKFIDKDGNNITIPNNFNWGDNIPDILTAVVYQEVYFTYCFEGMTYRVKKNESDVYKSEAFKNIWDDMYFYYREFCHVTHDTITVVVYMNNETQEHELNILDVDSTGPDILRNCEAMVDDYDDYCHISILPSIE